MRSWKPRWPGYLRSLGGHKLQDKPKAPVKYRGPNGETWRSRGSQPAWVRDQLAMGGKLEDLAA